MSKHSSLEAGVVDPERMGPARLEGVIDFLQSAAALKDTLRTGRTARGRRESTADHSWRLCLLAMLLADEMEGVDLVRLLQLCVVHDLAEAIAGDVPATLSRTATAEKRGNATRLPSCARPCRTTFGGGSTACARNMMPAARRKA